MLNLKNFKVIVQPYKNFSFFWRVQLDPDQERLGR
jgi:hypothetical protein